MSDVLRAFLLVAGALLATARNDTSARVMLDGGRYVPMWRGRLDPIYGLSYFTPSLIVNKCSPKYVSSTKLGQSLARLLACLLAGSPTTNPLTHPPTHLTHPPLFRSLADNLAPLSRERPIHTRKSLRTPQAATQTSLS